MYNRNKIFFSLLFRFILYSLLTLGLCEFIRADAQVAALGTKFDEGSYTELAQSLLLALLSGLYFLLYLRVDRFSVLSFTLFTLMMACFFREQDVYLDRYLYHGSWKLFSGAFLFLAAYLLISEWKGFMESLRRFYNSYTCGLMLSAMLSLFIFSRMFGRRVFWQAVMGSAYMRDVKNTAEECLELYGYAMLLISAIEYAILITRDKPSPILLSKNRKRVRVIRSMREGMLRIIGGVVMRMSFRKRKGRDRFWM